MTLNGRKLIPITYSTESNWFKDVPKSNWMCILVDNEQPRNNIDEVISKIINNDVCYVCTVGQSCEKNHDLIDEEIAFREVDADNLHLPSYDILTTWHTDFDEGIWFGIYAAHHDEVMIDKVVVLDMTNGMEAGIITKLIKEFSIRG